MKMSTPFHRLFYFDLSGNAQRVCAQQMPRRIVQVHLIRSFYHIARKRVMMFAKVFAPGCELL